jgi:enoyl reductase-like protein
MVLSACPRTDSSSLSIKDLIVVATGVGDNKWEGMCAKETGHHHSHALGAREPISKISIGLSSRGSRRG